MTTASARDRTKGPEIFPLGLFPRAGSRPLRDRERSVRVRGRRAGRDARTNAPAAAIFGGATREDRGRVAQAELTGSIEESTLHEQRHPPLDRVDIFERPDRRFRAPETWRSFGGLRPFGCMKPPGSPHARRTPGIASAALCSSTAMDATRLGPNPAKKSAARLFDVVGRIELEVVNA